MSAGVVASGEYTPTIHELIKVYGPDAKTWPDIARNLAVKSQLVADSHDSNPRYRADSIVDAVHESLCYGDDSAQTLQKIIRAAVNQDWETAGFWFVEEVNRVTWDYIVRTVERMPR